MREREDKDRERKRVDVRVPRKSAQKASPELSARWNGAPAAPTATRWADESMATAEPKSIAGYLKGEYSESTHVQSPED